MARQQVGKCEPLPYAPNHANGSRIADPLVVLRQRDSATTVATPAAPSSADSRPASWHPPRPVSAPHHLDRAPHGSRPRSPESPSSTPPRQQSPPELPLPQGLRQRTGLSGDPRRWLLAPHQRPGALRVCRCGFASAAFGKSTPPWRRRNGWFAERATASGQRLNGSSHPGSAAAGRGCRRPDRAYPGFDRDRDPGPPKGNISSSLGTSAPRSTPACHRPKCPCTDRRAWSGGARRPS